MVGCPPDFDRSQSPPTLTNPKLIVEVLSESTSTFDRGDKLEAYRRLASVEEILLADSRERAVTHHRRQADGSWLVRSLWPGDRVTLQSVDLTLELDALYAGLELGG